MWPFTQAMERAKKVDRRGRGIVITAARKVIGPEIAMLRVVERKAKDLNKRGRGKGKGKGKGKESEKEKDTAASTLEDGCKGCHSEKEEKPKDKDEEVWMTVVLDDILDDEYNLEGSSSDDLGDLDFEYDESTT